MNYLSSPQTYQAPIATYNFDIIGKALQYKQGQIDQNAAKIQQQIDTFSSLDIAREVDKQYFANKLNNIVSHVNSLPGADFSSQSTVNVITGNIRQAVDSNVLNAVASTKSIRATQAQLEDIKKNHPDKWAPQNEWVAFKGIDDYYANPEVGVKYQAADYTPYTDVNAKLKPYLENLQDHVSGIKKMFRGQGDLTGYFVTQEGKELSSREVREVAKGLLDPQSKAQIQIDGLYTYTREGAVDSVLVPEFSRYKDKQLESYTNTIKSNDLIINSPQATTAEKEKARQDNLSKKTDLSTLKSQFSQVEQNPNQMAYILQENNFLNSMGRLYDFSEVNETLSNDTSYWAAKNYELETEKFDYQKNKDTKEELNALRLATPTTSPDSVNLIEDTYKRIDQAKTGLAGFIQGKLNSPELASAKTQWEIDYSKLPASQKSGLTKETYILDRMRQSGYLNIADKKLADSYLQIINSGTETLLSQSDAVQQEMEDEKLPSTVQRLLGNVDSRMIDPDTKRVIPIAQYLQKNGITEQNANAILSPDKADVKKEILKAMYADDVLSNESTLSKVWQGAKGFVSGLFSGSPQSLAAGQASVAYQQEEYKQTGKAKRRLALLNNEDFVGGSTPNTDSYLATARKEGAYRTTAGFISNVNPFIYATEQIADPEISSDFVDRNEFDKRLAQRLATDTRLQQAGNFAIAPKSRQFEEIYLAANGADPSMGGRIDKDLPINARINPSDPSSIIITQRQKDGKEWTMNQVPLYLQNLPTVAATFEFNNPRNTYTPESFKGLKEKISVLSTDDTNVIHDIAENIYMQQGLDANNAINQAKINNTKEGILYKLNSVYPNVLNNTNGQATKYGLLANTILDDPNLTVEAIKTKLGVSVSINKGDQKLFTSDNLTPYSQLQPLVEKARYTPAEFVGSMLEQMVNEKAQYGTENLYNKIITKYNQ